MGPASYGRQTKRVHGVAVFLFAATPCWKKLLGVDCVLVLFSPPMNGASCFDDQRMTIKILMCVSYRIKPYE